MSVMAWMLVDHYQDNADWEHRWLKTGFWHILFYGILVAIAVLWRPSDNNAR